MSMNTILDWMTAIGLIIGIVAGAWGIVLLFIKDKDKQKQIDSFEQLAKEAAVQSKQFAAQVKEMQEGNNILKEQLEIRKSLNDERKKEEEKRVKKRKENIKPKFEIIKGIGMDLRIDLASVDFVNIGEVAMLKEIKTKEKNSVNINYHLYTKEIKNSGRLLLQLKPSTPGVKINQCILCFDLIYLDEDGNKYSQFIEGDISESSISISEPEEIE